MLNKKSHTKFFLFIFFFFFKVYASSADLDVVDDGDGSIYNGDENHKVWSGSQDRLDAIGAESPYDFYSGGTSTLSRTQRARQISAPIPVPPPPKDDLAKKRHANNMKDNKKSRTAGSQSLSGTLIRPKPVHANTLMRSNGGGAGGPPAHIVGTMLYGPVGQHQQQRQFHTFSHRGYIDGSNIGPNGHIIAMAPQQLQHHHHHHMQMQMPVMVPQQYATLQNPRMNNNKKQKKKDKMNGIPIGVPVPPPLFAYPQPSMIAEPRPLAMSNRKLTQSAAAGLDDIATHSNSGAESPGGTGIYRRKGHLNERAFSYSIRQEHRSRSHGSLASLQFNPPDVKKEREIAQMVAGLELNDDQSSGLHQPPLVHNNNNNNMRNHQLPIPATGTFGKPRR